jgi:hypothetical protein
MSILRIVGKWAHATFPQWTNHGIITHLRREIDELESDPTSGEEMAKIVILLCHLAWEHGVDLEDAIIVKHAINKNRTWANPDADGVAEHVR